MKQLSYVAGLIVVVGALACASSSPTTTPRADRDVLTRAQIDSLNLVTAYDIVQKVRPDMLRGRGRTSGDGQTRFPIVVIDGRPHGYPEVLRNVSANTVERIRFLGSRDALTQYGMGLDTHAGLIEVTLRK